MDHERGPYVQSSVLARVFLESCLLQGPVVVRPEPETPQDLLSQSADDF